MTEYKPKFADPNEYVRMGFPVKNRYDKAVCESYLRRLNLYTREEFEAWKKNLDKQFLERESSWFQKLMGQLWYRLVLPKIGELTSPKQLFKVLSQIDKLIPYLPVGYWTAVLKGIDWVADLVYKNMDS